MERWTAKEAWKWYEAQPWLVGCNFSPSTAINQLEMWQEETFDPATIKKELSWAAGLGMNVVRVYLHDLLWEDQEGLISRMNTYLEIAHEQKISTMFVLFDDCWNPNPKLGIQPPPKPGIHNSGWLQSPGVAQVGDQSIYPRLETFVRGVVGAFRDDPRILAWDLYNEPGNRDSGDKSADLLDKAFDWARAAKPSQPLTSGLWRKDGPRILEIQRTRSDVITFHNYGKAENLQRLINKFKDLERPMICTEYMARTNGSLFKTSLPIFKKEKVGAINWGLVAGKTNTIFAWGAPSDKAEPDVWFHDIFRPDGSVYSEEEVDLIRRLTDRT